MTKGLISTFVVYRYSNSCNQTLITLFNMWMYNDRLASYVAFQAGGFAYLLDNIV